MMNKIEVSPAGNIQIRDAEFLKGTPFSGTFAE